MVKIAQEISVYINTHRRRNETQPTGVFVYKISVNQFEAFCSVTHIPKPLETKFSITGILCLAGNPLD